MAPPASAPMPAPISALLRSLPPASRPRLAPARAPRPAPAAVLEIFWSPVYGSVVVQALTSTAVATTTSTVFFIRWSLSKSRPLRPRQISPSACFVTQIAAKSGTAKPWLPEVLPVDHHHFDL